MSLTKNIKREPLDFILTDLIPQETSELYSNRNFYEFLLKDKALQELHLKVLDDKKINKQIFCAGWNCSPLRYNIKKKNGFFRELSLINPLGLLMIYEFNKIYSGEILNSLNNKNRNMFSLRYHTNESNLYYQSSSKFIVKYYQKVANYLNKANIEQTGQFYKIKQFRTITNFTNSKLWYTLNNKFKYFARLDYKECFSSIYTHVYGWIDTNNNVDSKNFKNTSLYNTIDNVLQRSNAGITNGIIIGPEFYRMMAELLLQSIDSNIYHDLRLKNLKFKEDYYICRYVDDIFVFANSEENLNVICNQYFNADNTYKLKINENKIIKQKLPYIPNLWIKDVSEFSGEIESFFKNDDGTIKFKKLKKSISTIKNNINIILNNYNNDQYNSIVGYWLSTFFNVLSPQKGKCIFDKDISKTKVLSLLDVVFYIYSKSITNVNTNKLVAILNFIFQYLQDKDMVKYVLNKIVQDYSYILLENTYDIINLLPLFLEYKIEIPSIVEDKLFNKIKELEDPILIANYICYSTYNENYFKKVLEEIEPIIELKIKYLENEEKNFYMYKETWFYYIFYNCPYINQSLKQQIINKIKSLNLRNGSESYDIANKIICRFMINDQKGFFTWKLNKWNYGDQISYRTHQKTLFKTKRSYYISYDYGSF